MGLVAILGVTDGGVIRAKKYMDAYTARYDDVHVMNDLRGASRNLKEIKYDGLLVVEDLPILKEDGKTVSLLEDKASDVDAVVDSLYRFIYR